MNWTKGEVRYYVPIAGGCCFCLYGQRCRYGRRAGMKYPIVTRKKAPFYSARLEKGGKCKVRVQNRESEDE